MCKLLDIWMPFEISSVRVCAHMGEKTMRLLFMLPFYSSKCRWGVWWLLMGEYYITRYSDHTNYVSIHLFHDMYVVFKNINLFCGVIIEQCVECMSHMHMTAKVCTPVSTHIDTRLGHSVSSSTALRSHWTGWSPLKWLLCWSEGERRVKARDLMW